ncbi:hypothetical protein VM1G_04740 [Cytospora mali]|uniref:Uncharacterized protein n=1 Tax=Cytospora mali TaxID=578113 RepID=A0A194VZC0_CYTMA|nr:hypothetical protein VM1G_04740 [Valsa mali]
METSNNQTSNSTTKPEPDNANPLKTRTVDTDVTSHTASESIAVTHEFIQPKLHEIYEKNITREIHHHHIYHRTLPLLKTETLPARHFVDSSDGKGLVEVSEVEVRQQTGLPVREWLVIPRSSVSDGQQYGTQRSSHIHREHLQPEHLIDLGTEPILMDKKTYVTEEGFNRTEYLWRHPPVFEDVHGRTTPVRIPAGVSDDWRQAAMNAKRHVSVSHGANDTARDVKRVHSVDRGVPVHKKAGSDRRNSIKSAGRQVIPAQVNSMATSGHGGLAIRTVPREGNMVENGGETPNLVRKGSLQNLKGADKAEAAQSPLQEDGESAKLRRKKEEEARQLLLKNEWSIGTGSRLSSK